MLRRKNMITSLGLSGAIFTLIGAGLVYLAGVLTGAGTESTTSNSKKRQDDVIDAEYKELN